MEVKMTKQEAVNRIIEHMTIHHLSEPQAVYISEALDMAVAALKKQIPLPVHHTIGSDGNYTKITYCYSCTRYVKDFKYCPDCGQLLGWDAIE